MSYHSSWNEQTATGLRLDLGHRHRCKKHTRCHRETTASKMCRLHWELESNKNHFSSEEYPQRAMVCRESASCFLCAPGSCRHMRSDRPLLYCCCRQIAKRIAGLFRRPAG